MVCVVNEQEVEYIHDVQKHFALLSYPKEPGDCSDISDLVWPLPFWAGTWQDVPAAELLNIFL